MSSLGWAYAEGGIALRQNFINSFRHTFSINVETVKIDKFTNKIFKGYQLSNAKLESRIFVNFPPFFSLVWQIFMKRRFFFI